MTTAATRTRATPVVEDLIAQGVHALGPVCDSGAATDLLTRLRADRTFGPELFMTEAEFDADPQYTGVNPRPGRNLLEAHAERLAFVEQAPAVTETLRALFGADHVVLDKKVVCGVPASWIPDWLRARIEGNPVNNLGPYIRPEFRDVTYFYGIDFHQDLIDHKAREADFITLYIYLHEVGRDAAPLFVLPESHRFGGTLFPHDLQREEGGVWRYGDRRGRALHAPQMLLTGPAGYAALWHACTLHGTQPNAGDRERLSLRYLIAKSGAARCGIDDVNAALEGPLSLTDTRFDLAADGSSQIKFNAVRAA